LELTLIQVSSHKFVSLEAGIITVENILKEIRLHFNPPIIDLKGPLLIQLPTPIVSLWCDNFFYQSLISDSRTLLLRTPSSFFTMLTMDQSTYTESTPGSVPMQTSPLTVSGPSLFGGVAGISVNSSTSSVTHNFGGPSVPHGYQSLSRTFFGASTNASLFITLLGQLVFLICLVHLTQV